ncbi:MAG TPA: HDOD domain-containing protein [bacterium]|nr:HDOD domain-containing protein [bacterium]
MNETTRNRIVDKIRDLPTLPSTVAQIISVTNDPEASVEDLKKIIEADQVVAGRILRAVNSAYYGFPRQVDTLSKAIVILGFNNVRSIALSVSIMELFPMKSPNSFSYNQLWAHAVGVAHCARSIARVFNPRQTEQYFVAGLLHDIGLVAMNQCFPDDFINCYNSAIKQKRPLFEVEVERFEFDHADVSQFVADRWLLPSTLSTAIGLHHRPHEANDNDKIVYAIHTADIICKTMAFGDYGDNAPFSLDSIYKPAAKMFEITPEGPSGNLKKILAEDLKEAEGFVKLFD